MRLQFHPEASQELDDAIDYYNRERADLGTELGLEMADCLDAILSLPNAWPVVAGGVRRCRANRFPYGIVYTIEADVIRVLAVMHLHRKPGYWSDRT